jgi:hypothetical protein
LEHLIRNQDNGAARRIIKRRAGCAGDANCRLERGLTATGHDGIVEGVENGLRLDGHGFDADSVIHCGFPLSFFETRRCGWSRTRKMNSALGFFGSAAPSGAAASRTAPTAIASASTVIPQDVCFMDAILDEISGLFSKV